MEKSIFDPGPFFEHLRSDADPMEAPGLSHLLEEIEIRAKRLIKSSLNISSVDSDDVAKDIMMSALEKIQNRTILDQYCSDKGRSLANYFANFAVQRATDRTRSLRRESSIAQKRFMGSGEIDTSFRDLVQGVRFRPRARNKTTTPLNALSAQLEKKIDWADHSALESQVLKSFQSRQEIWRQRIEQRRREGQAQIDETIEALKISSIHALRLSNDSAAESASADHDAYQRSMQQQRVLEKRRRSFHHWCVEGTWFPLTSDDLQELLSLGTTSNAHQVRSRSRRQLLDLLTTTDDKKDQGIREFFRLIKLDPADRNLVDVSEQGEE
ncbi:hypothetical protein OAN47_00570 [Planctomycetota bacterium]|nr:hypothetical protein [Planctomycetota bacterium]